MYERIVKFEIIFFYLLNKVDVRIWKYYYDVIGFSGELKIYNGGLL